MRGLGVLNTYMGLRNCNSSLLFSFRRTIMHIAEIENFKMQDTEYQFIKGSHCEVERSREFY